MGQEPKTQKAKNKDMAPAPGRVEILYYTDPLCCWSWGFEASWNRIRSAFGDAISWRYCMGGLLPTWKNFHDTINSVTRPLQMGPVWMHAGQVAGVSINHRIWMEDPPASSYPACMAVKCAEFQSTRAGDIYLSLLRKACMLNGQNIAKKDILMQVAADMAQDNPGLLNLAVFKKDFNSEPALDAFRKDLQQAQYHHINRFPTLIIRGQQRPAVLLTGYIPYDVLFDTVSTYCR